MRVSDADRAFEQAGFLDPGSAGHLAISVEREPAGVGRVRVARAAGKDGGDTGADGAFADLERAVAMDQSGEADLDAGHVGYGIEGAGDAVEGDSEVTGADGFGWVGLGHGHGGAQKHCETAADGEL